MLTRILTYMGGHYIRAISPPMNIIHVVRWDRSSPISHKIERSKRKLYRRSAHPSAPSTNSLSSTRLINGCCSRITEPHLAHNHHQVSRTRARDIHPISIFFAMLLYYISFLTFVRNSNYTTEYSCFSLPLSSEKPACLKKKEERRQ